MAFSLLPQLKQTIDGLKTISIARDRVEVLQHLIDYIQSKVDGHSPISLNFICTHNSRRSQLSQIWAQTAADYYGIPVQCYSGGTEATAFNERAVAALSRAGFDITATGQGNPLYIVKHSPDHIGIRAFSKIYDDPENGTIKYAAVMTCAHADDNCPFIPSAEARIPVRYEDPKAFDGTPQETAKYDERSIQIASEMFYVFSKIKY